VSSIFFLLVLLLVLEGSRQTELFAE
jgi:hypothetical protein